MSAATLPLSVLCFGEVLWDMLPHGRFLGGAPLNVAYHLKQLGCEPRLVSAVGADALGRAAHEAMAAAGLSTRAVSAHAFLPTGTAEVTLDAAGVAKFVIHEPVAWDEVSTAEAIHDLTPAVIVFGSLALRGAANRRALTELLDASPQAWVVADLNLRPPFDDLRPLAPLLRRIHLLKLNAEEARRLCARPADACDWSAMAAELSTAHAGADVAITLGADGAGLLADGGWHQVSAPPVVVRDTVGAGDAFTAALIAGRIRAAELALPPDWPQVLRAACALGAFVASRDGAQPVYNPFEIGG